MKSKIIKMLAGNRCVILNANLSLADELITGADAIIANTHIKLRRPGVVGEGCNG